MERTNRRKVRKGTVVSDKMQKTVVVLVEDKKQHPLYKKYVRVSKRYKVHDENSKARLGDTVEIVETRPLSKDKCWRLLNILSHSAEAEATK